MKILEVLPRDIVVRTEFTIKEINMFLDFIDHCTVEVDPNDSNMVEADKYVRSIFKELGELADNIDIEKSG
jgi:hypothetical protein